MINILADILLVCVIVLCAFIGKTRGFIKTFFGFFGSLISFLFASFLAKPVGAWLGKTFFLSPIKAYIMKSVSDQIGGSVEEAGLTGFLSAGEEFLSRFGVNTQLISSHAEEMGEEAVENTADSIAEYIGTPIADSIGSFVSFILLFILFLIGVRILVRILDLFSRLPGLNFSNRFLGLGVGLLQGLLVSVLISSALCIVAPGIQSVSGDFFSAFDPEETILVQFFSKFNFVF
jgi:uncharacterized membrane protein required for colicin V production